MRRRHGGVSWCELQHNGRGRCVCTSNVKWSTPSEELFEWEGTRGREGGRSEPAIISNKARTERGTESLPHGMHRHHGGHGWDCGQLVNHNSKATQELTLQPQRHCMAANHNGESHQDSSVQHALHDKVDNNK